MPGVPVVHTLSGQRVLLNRSQNWLAREIGVSPGYVSNRSTKGERPRDASENGCRRPSA